MPDLLDGLNPEQLAAVTQPPVHALVLAGAGSGKTRVLTTRIAWLIATGQVSPQGILAVTFTNKAAKEMVARLTSLVPSDPRGMWVGTFHGLCHRLLRIHHREAALPAAFQILDMGDQLSAIKRLLKQLNASDERFPAKQVQSFINRAKESAQRAKDVAVRDAYSDAMKSFYAAYEQQCQREGVVDFAELMLRTYELLQRDTALRHHYQARFRHVLVDEFQDTNDLQYDWLSLFVGEGNALFAVGDDDQSIYAFRGANSGNMLRFDREFARGNLIKLEQNYRSSGHILAAANELIRQNSQRLGKTLWTDAGEGEPLRVFEANLDTQEASWVVEEIAQLTREGLLRSDCAILYRSNAQSRLLEHALFSREIPYRVFGGLRFFERAEIKHALAYLRLIENVDDDTAFLRVVNVPPRGVGARSLEQLQDLARTHGLSLFRASAYLSGRAAAVVSGFTQLIEELQRANVNLALPALVSNVIERSGLMAHFLAEKEGQDRVDNLNELVNAAAAFGRDQGWSGSLPAALGLAAGDSIWIDSDDDGSAPNLLAPEPEAVLGQDALQLSPLTAFLTHASLESGESQAGEGVDAVQLMTVHASKGLEFKVVFLVGLEDGLFPHQQSQSTSEGIEEERRLMYVAVTRARQRLYLAFASQRMLHGQTMYTTQSRFLAELPEGCLKWLSARQKKPSWQSAGAKAAVPGYGGEPVPYTPAKSGFALTTTDGRSLPIRAGLRLRHGRFGDGVVVKLEGNGDDARAQINFGAAGLKWLALAVAKLDPI